MTYCMLKMILFIKARTTKKILIRCVVKLNELNQL